MESGKFYFHLYEAEFGERAVLGHSKVRSDRDGTIYLSLGERPVSRVRSVFAKQSTQARFTRTGQDRCHEVTEMEQSISPWERCHEVTERKQSISPWERCHEVTERKQSISPWERCHEVTERVLLTLILKTPSPRISDFRKSSSQNSILSEGEVGKEARYD